MKPTPRTASDPSTRLLDQSSSQGARPELKRINALSSDSSLTSKSLPSSSSSSSTRSGRSNSSKSKDGHGSKSTKGKTPGNDSRDDADLASLRDAVNKKLLVEQQRASKMSRTGDGTAAAQRRPSPVAEESPPSASNPSSGSGLASSGSSKTVRAVPTPGANQPLRTPSYPFPFVPGSPRIWSPAFHQPFTVLSPTTSAEPSSTPGDSTISTTSTPRAMYSPFDPHGAVPPTASDPRYPSPNLWDTVLQLGIEPGLDAWWTTVTKILHDSYLADRVSLALPADANDIENVPWGQKATFNVSGQAQQTEDALDAKKRDKSNTTSEPAKQVKPNVLLARPGLESRHSYSGAGIFPKASTTKPMPFRELIPPARPGLPSRAVSYAPSSLRNESTMSNAGFSPVHPSRHASLSDPDFSSVGDDRTFIPQLSVFPVLRGLDSEMDGLIDASSVNRVLERGSLVTLTRDYTVDPDAKTPQPDPRTLEVNMSRRKSVGRTMPFRIINPDPEVGGPRRGSAFEEYEQIPPSPWSQSPAPSPAIQADPNENPFFATDSVEDSFNPAATPSSDYAKLQAIEAIGVDKASTVIHLPLVHPTLSGVMPNFNDGGLLDPQGGSPDSQATDKKQERRAPIAIISILSPAVPYPPNLAQSLKLLGPHLATSYSMAQQFTAVQTQLAVGRHKKALSGKLPAPLSLISSDLNQLMRENTEDPAFPASASITSPSEYSGRSRHSPRSSISGTPGWADASFLQGTSRSVVATPAGDNYFDSGEGYFERSGADLSRSKSVTGRISPALTPSKTEDRSGKLTTARKSNDDRSVRSSKPEKSPARQVNACDEGPQPSDVASPRKSSFRTPTAPDNADRLHTVLHSYGADFSSSFQSLPAPATPKPSLAGLNKTHSRIPSMDSPGMPPPSERLLRTIIDSLPVQIFTAAPGSGELTWVNSKFLVYRGQDARQVLEDPWSTIHPDDRLVWMEQWSKSLKTGQQLQQKVRLQRFDGAYRWFYVRAAPLKDKRQSIVHWIGTNMDFHEQHLAETNAARQQETAASEAKYRALANSSPQVVFTVNRAKGITFCNTQWSIYSGQAELQALGLGFMEHVHPEDIVKCKLPHFFDGNNTVTNVPISVRPGPVKSQASSGGSSSESTDTPRGPTSPMHSPPPTELPQRKLSELATTGILKVTRDADGKAAYSTEVRLKSKDGDYRWHLVRVLLAGPELQIHDEEETWYGTCTDINDHKALEHNLKETMDEKSRFLSNMSHEIRTPLNGITGMVNFLIDSSLTEEQMEHVSIIRSSTEGLRGLINDILDLSKAEAGMIQLSMEWVHVSSLIEEVNDLASTMAIDKGLELNYIVEPDVPSQIKADRFRIRQILLNIVGNAIKFTQVGEVFVRCSVLPSEEALSATEMLIQFEITDTGQGFTEKEAHFLFKRFSQIDGSSTRQHGGTGLGLVISRQLAELHGGDMSAVGYPGKGATFRFFIKTTLPTDQDQPPAPPPTPGVNPPSSTAGKKLVAAPAKGIPASLTGRILQGSPLPMDLPPHPTSQISPGVSKVAGSPSASIASTGSEVSAQTTRTSIKSERSSASSYIPEIIPPREPMHLTMPKKSSSSRWASGDHGVKSEDSLRPSDAQSPPPPMFSILVVCPLKHSREATVKHIDMTLPETIPHQITARESLAECRRMIGGEESVVFSHVVLLLQSVPEIVAFMDHFFPSEAHASTQLIVITDNTQRRKIMEVAPSYDYPKLSVNRTLRFIFKPLKPSKFGPIFDPQKEREMSTDRNQDSAQHIAMTQKQLYDEMTRRIGNQSKRILLVEDNKINQMVLLKFLSKVSIAVDTVLDGQQCTEKIYSKPHGYYSTILCDLHMPNKDGYQTCREIRKWEKENNLPYLPIIALSANVLGDVYAKCVEAGFNSYVTKPVDFQELSQVMLRFLDPPEPGKPIEFMRMKKKGT